MFNVLFKLFEVTWYLKTVGRYGATCRSDILKASQLHSLRASSSIPSVPHSPFPQCLIAPFQPKPSEHHSPHPQSLIAPFPQNLSSVPSESHLQVLRAQYPYTLRISASPLRALQAHTQNIRSMPSEHHSPIPSESHFHALKTSIHSEPLRSYTQLQSLFANALIITSPYFPTH